MKPSLLQLPLSSLMGEPAGAAPSSRLGMLPDSQAAASQISRTFTPQSYCDDILQEYAIVRQDPNEPIVKATEATYQGSGYAVALHPSSQTPIALSFGGGGRHAGSSVYTLRPGQIVRPTGLLNREGRSGFNSFKYGIPYGWLGGGTATLFVLQTPDARVDWTTDTEVAFHRQRVRIIDPGDLPTTALDIAANWPANWPLRFPSQLTRRGETDNVTFNGSTPQRGQPQIAIARTGRMIMRLRKRLTAPADMRALCYRITDFDRNSIGSSGVEVSSVDITWPSVANMGLPGIYDEHTVILGPEILSCLGFDGAIVGADPEAPQPFVRSGIRFISSDAGLINAYIDIERRGYL